MKTTLVSSLRAAALVSALLLVPTLSIANDAAASDAAARLLAASGTVPVKAAGPYVQAGSYRIHVSKKLGQPSAILTDGTWLYRNFTVDESNATGTLVVRFENNRVSQLSLVSPKVETAMRANAAKAKAQVAAK